MDQGLIGMEKYFSTSSTPYHLLTTHHGRRNSSPKSHPNALKAVLAPAIWMDFPAPRQGMSDPHKDWTLILGKVVSMENNYPPPSTYLSRSPCPELLQPREPSCHVLERLMDTVVISSPRQDPSGVPIREYHHPAHACNLLNGTHQDSGRRRSQVRQVVGVRTRRLILQPRGLQ